MERDCTVAGRHLNQQRPEFALIQGRLTAFLAVLARGAASTMAAAANARQNGSLCRSLVP